MFNKVIKLLLIALLLLPIFACQFPSGDGTTDGGNDGGWTEGVFDHQHDPNLIDYSTQVTLNQTDLDTDFNVTGRGYVTVETHIDGDTVHFYNNSKTELLKVRFIAVDTPESTGKIEPWGKPASQYTKERLAAAEKIVLESNTPTPTFDSTGERYLAWVWYKLPGETNYHNLNIELLQEGLAMGKNSSDNIYGETAVLALTQARENNINLYSAKKDPLFYYGDVVEVTIKSLVADIEGYNGLKVRFDGVVTKLDGNGAYVEQFDEDTGFSYGVYVYYGFHSLAAKFFRVGYKLRITGNAENSETYGFQVTGLNFSSINPTKDDTTILEKGIEVQPTILVGKDIETREYIENTLVKMENLVVDEEIWTTQEGASKGAMTLDVTAPDGTKFQVRTSVLYEEDGETLITADYFAGKTITVTGVIEKYQGKLQLRLFALSGCEIITDAE